MYKVLITDDEPTIREGLRTLIEWERYGFEVVDTAANANEALQKYKVYSPELMIVDIRMPGISGLELIEALRKAGQGVHILILTGYADFEYARKAIVNQVDGYLLKPVDEEELIGYLEKLKASLSTEADSRHKINVMSGLSRQMIIQSILTRGGAAAPLYGNDQAAETGLLWDSFEVVLLKWQGRDQEIEAGTTVLIKEGLSQMFEDSGRGVTFMMEPYFGLLLKEDLQNEQRRNGIYKEIEDLMAKAGAEFTLAAGGSVDKLNDIRSSYEKAERLMHVRFYYEPDRIITSGDIPVVLSEPVEPNLDEPLDYAAVADKIFFAIDIGNSDSVEQLLESAGKRMLRARQSEQAIKSGFVQIVTGVLGKLAQADSDNQTNSHQHSVRIMEIYKQMTYTALVRHVVRFLQEMSDGMADRGTDKQIKKMIDLIGRNYYENLKLESLAEVFNYNSAYLGKLFKNATGEYFNTYLDKVRIEKAKELLEQGMKVYQVAEKVGYTNVDYFHSKFRKYEGSSPSAYRKK
ncbi:response regulator transcription factor [Paenibacillus sp. sptzw28]|uniref:response regulator transcription factor n=1 Tax=Paenibacillus sp. sptzw28 TaxID=715179 RepID=UPI001C6EA4BD|nr:response regulator transcription factor [Paenibacillus sp. sptzw28]QYR23249.1 response regulator transcription factor [Paenibacillus sp. sptzw28]